MTTQRRPIDPAKQRTVSRSTQSPVLIPAEYPHHSHPDATPQPMIPESDLKRKLIERRSAEKRAVTE